MAQYNQNFDRFNSGCTVASYAISDEQGARKKVLDNQQ
jgi:hypothetical protein